MEEFKYRQTFEAVAKLVSPSKEDRFVAKASLVPLKGLLPADIDPENDPDLLYLSCNGAVAGLVNKNGDSISCQTALSVYKTSKNKYITTDHDRQKVVGVILYPGLSRFGNNTPISEEEGAASKEPFNMSFAGILWKVINPGLSKYIRNTGDETNSDSLSMSWEIAFNSYDIGIGSKNVFDATVIKADDPAFGSYEKYLKSKGGDGKDPAGREVFRIITGDPIILGYSIVPNPAAEVKGILPISKADDEEKNGSPASVDLSEIPESQRGFLEGKNGSDAAFHICDIIMSDGTVNEKIPVLNGRYIPKNIDTTKIASIKISEKIEEKNITPVNDRVTINIAQTMKIEKVEQIESQWSEIRKLESAAAVTDFVKAIQQGSEEFVKQLEAKENLVKSAEAARAESEKRAKGLETSLAELNETVKALRAKAEAAEAMEKFNDRMSELDNEFELDDDDRKVLASDIKGLDDSSFAAYMAKCKVLMKGKSKAAKKAAKDKSDKDADDAKAAEAAKTKEAIASVKESDEDKTIKSTVTVDENITQQMAEAFGASLKINGKPAVEQKTEKK